MLRQMQPEHLISRFSEIRTMGRTFITERKSQNLSPKTIIFYQGEIDLFLRWLEKRQILALKDLQAGDIREYLTDLGNRRNKGGIHASYRAIKAFLRFYEFEYEPENWKNPINKVRLQSQKPEPLKGISIDQLTKFLEVIEGKHALRDRAIFSGLASSGLRVSEFLALNLEDVDVNTGTIRVRHGKGDKPRIAFLGKEARSALKRYLKIHPKDVPAVWTNDEGERMTISGLRYSLVKYSKLAGIGKISLHDFRRCFALSCYRKGVDIFSISQLLGHSTVEVTKRYIAINEEDLQLAHMKGDPL